MFLKDLQKGLLLEQQNESIRQNIAIVYSRNSYRHYCAQAEKNGLLYRFRGAESVLHWLKGEYAYLAVNGLANFLRRLGIKFDIVQEKDLSHCIDSYHTIFIPNAEMLSRDAMNAIKRWHARDDHFLIVSGKTNLPAGIFGAETFTPYIPNGYITWTSHETITPSRQRKKTPLTIIGQRGYTLYQTKIKEKHGENQRPVQKTSLIGTLYEVEKGESKNPSGKQRVEAAILCTAKSLYLPVQTFEFLGGLLQGHLSFEDVRKWHTEHFFIDDLCMGIKEILQRAHPRLFAMQLRPFGKYGRAVVLRHDTDLAFNTEFLEFEVQEHIPATYALLLDENKERWIKATQGKKGIETCFHYYTCMREHRFQEKLRNFIANRLLGKKTVLRIDRKAISGTGLYKQIAEAEQQDIRAKTAQRHAKFFLYPETIDAMNYLYNHDKAIVGLGSMFRFVNYQYGRYAYTVEHPQVSVPFWFPLRMMMAAQECHAMLRGWDSCHLLEPEPKTIDHVLGHTVLENAVFTFGFHPRHVVSGEFNPGSRRGTWDWFMYVITEARKVGCMFLNCAQLYQRMEELEHLCIREEKRTIIVFNAGKIGVRDIHIKYKNMLHIIPAIGTKQKKIIKKKNEEKTNERAQK